MAKDTPTEKLLEEEGRIKSEPQTKNVRAEERRVVAEIKDEKDWKKAHSFLRSQLNNQKGFMPKHYKGKTGEAYKKAMKEHKTSVKKKKKSKKGKKKR